MRAPRLAKPKAGLAKLTAWLHFVTSGVGVPSPRYLALFLKGWAHV